MVSLKISSLSKPRHILHGKLSVEHLHYPAHLLVSNLDLNLFSVPPHTNDDAMPKLNHSMSALAVVSR